MEMPNESRRVRRRSGRLPRVVVLGGLVVGVLGGLALARVAELNEPEALPVVPNQAGEEVLPELRQGDEDVCCKHEDGLVSIAYLSACRRAKGSVVDRKICTAALKPVCCRRAELADWSDTQGCQRRGGVIEDEMMCRTQYDLVCCEYPKTTPLPGGWYSWVTRDRCAKSQGQERAKSACGDPLEKVCCQSSEGALTVNQTTRQNCRAMNHHELPRDQCDNVCCRHDSRDLGTRWETRNNCGTRADGPGHAVSAVECEDTCCKLSSGGTQILHYRDCEDRRGIANPLNECGTTVEVEKPVEDSTKDPTEAPPVQPTEVIDRPPATTPYQ